MCYFVILLTFFKRRGPVYGKLIDTKGNAKYKKNQEIDEDYKLFLPISTGLVVPPVSNMEEGVQGVSLSTSE